MPTEIDNPVERVDAATRTNGTATAVTADMSRASPPPTTGEWFTVQCGYGSLNACTVVVDASSLDDACEAAIEAANNSVDWRQLDGCGSTYVDAMAKGQDVHVWTAAGSEIPVPPQFTERGEAAMLEAALSRLLEWADQMGGWDAPCWDEARALLHQPHGHSA